MKRIIRRLELSCPGILGLFFAEDLWAFEGGGGFSGEVLWQIVSFLLLGFFLSRLLKKPLRSFLFRRKEEIRNSLDQASRKEDEARRLLTEWETKLSSLSQEVDELHQSLYREGETERQRIIERAQQEEERIRKQTQFIAEQEVKKAQASLKKEMVDLSLELAEGLLKEKVRPDDQERLAREYMEKMRGII